MRLLLDEHYPPQIAQGLRERGHDAMSVDETERLRGWSDRQIWNHARSERRALVTENSKHFMPLVLEAALEGDGHWGVLFSSPHSMPRGRNTIGLYVERLDQFLTDHPTDDALADQVAWLSPAAG